LEILVLGSIYTLSGSENLQVFFLLFIYLWIAVGDPIIKRGMVRIPFTSLTLSHIFACLKPGPGFPT
jgi:hypothetical protein